MLTHHVLAQCRVRLKRRFTFVTTEISLPPHCILSLNLLMILFGVAPRYFLTKIKFFRNHFPNLMKDDVTADQKMMTMMFIMILLMKSMKMRTMIICGWWCIEFIEYAPSIIAPAVQATELCNPPPDQLHNQALASQSNTIFTIKHQLHNQTLAS